MTKQTRRRMAAIQIPAIMMIIGHRPRARPGLHKLDSEQVPCRSLAWLSGQTPPEPSPAVSCRHRCQARRRCEKGDLLVWEDETSRPPVLRRAAMRRHPRPGPGHADSLRRTGRGFTAGPTAASTRTPSRGGRSGPPQRVDPARG